MITDFKIFEVIDYSIKEGDEVVCIDNIGGVKSLTIGKGYWVAGVSDKIDSSTRYFYIQKDDDEWHWQMANLFVSRLDYDSGKFGI